MKKLLFVVAGISLLFAGDQAPEFEAHEWGVFMFYQGLGADILASQGADLPHFIVRAESIKEDQKKCKDCGANPCKCIKPPKIIEEYLKPVINFYTKSKISINISVSASTGKHTVWYPKHTGVSNDFTRLDWSVDIVPKSDILLREPKGCSWWGIARDTDSAYVATKDEAEKFIFYEGENTKLQAEIEIKRNGEKIELINKSTRKFTTVLVVYDKKIVCIDEFNKSQEIKFDKVIDQKTAVEKLVKLMIDEGLNEKEAKGVAKIWEKDFFETDGLKVIYSMSRKDIDNALPLTIEPKPKKLARVMLACVNDTDLIIEKLIKQLADDNPVKRDSATQTLIRMGQKIKSHLEKALRETKDAEVKSRLERIIDEINKASSGIKPDDKEYIKDGVCKGNKRCREEFIVTTFSICKRCNKKGGLTGNPYPYLCTNCCGELGICPVCHRKEE